MNTTTLPESLLYTEGLLDFCVQTQIYRPLQLHRDHIVLLPYDKVPLLHPYLHRDETFLVPGTLEMIPHVVLGSLDLRPDGKYYAKETYQVRDIVQRTLTFAQYQAKQNYAAIPSEENRQRFESLTKRLAAVEKS